MKIETKSLTKVGATILLLFLCIHYWSSIASFGKKALSAASPLLAGCVLAYVLYPACNG